MAETWYWRSGSGAACGPGTRRPLNQTAGSSAATQDITSEHTWNRSESARTIAAGNWSVWADITTGAGGGAPNKVTVVIERRDSSCTVQQTIGTVEVTMTAGTTQEYQFDFGAPGAVVFASGDILTCRIIRSNGGRTQVLRFDGAATGDADTRLIHPDPAANDADAEVSWTEFEVPTPSADAEVSWAELEVPLAPAGAEVSWAELEVPTPDSRADISWAELEVPTPDSRADVSWTELEVPSLNADAEVSWTEFEVPLPSAAAEVSWTELEVPTPDGDAEVSWAELEVPTPDAAAHISWAEVEIPTESSDAEVSFGELEVPTPSARADISWAEFQVWRPLPDVVDDVIAVLDTELATICEPKAAYHNRLLRHSLISWDDHG